jgi:hypothetical protein
MNEWKKNSGRKRDIFHPEARNLSFKNHANPVKT